MFRKFIKDFMIGFREGYKIGQDIARQHKSQRDVQARIALEQFLIKHAPWKKDQIKFTN